MNYDRPPKMHPGNNLTYAKYLLATGRAILYAPDENLKRDKVIFFRGNKTTPAFLVCHPLDVQKLEQITEKKLISIQEWS